MKMEDSEQQDEQPRGTMGLVVIMFVAVGLAVLGVDAILGTFTKLFVKIFSPQ